MLALVFNQPQGQSAPPPATPAQQTGGAARFVIVETKTRVGAKARPLPMVPALVLVEPVTIRTGSRLKAQSAVAIASATHATARGGASVRVQSGTAIASTLSADVIAVHNPTDEDLLVLSRFYPSLFKAHRRTLPAIDRQRHAVLHAESAIKAHVRSFLHMMAVRLAMLARGRHVHKAASADDEVKAAAEATDFDQLEQEIAPYLRAVAKDGAREGLRQVDADIEAMLSQANERAVTWANDHAGVLIKGIAATTRGRVAELVARSAAEGWAHDRLAEEIQGAGVFGEARAEMIARTESAFADVHGSLIGWKASGVVAAKMWRTGGGACDECEPLDGETVPLDEEFEEGDPPKHPRCRCDLIPVLGEAE